MYTIEHRWKTKRAKRTIIKVTKCAFWVLVVHVLLRVSNNAPHAAARCRHSNAEALKRGGHYCKCAVLRVQGVLATVVVTLEVIVEQEDETPELCRVA